MGSGSKIELGKAGEEMAVQFLVEKGYKIIEQNYRFGHGEIDIIAEDKGILVFVEVKTRNTLEFGRPEEAVSRSKLKRIKKIAEGYLYEKEIDDKVCRLDVIAILQMKGIKEINHIENAYTFLG